MTFYLCEHCGNLVEMIQDAGVNPVCCGEKMVKLNANSTDAATEKHVPVVTVEKDKVSVCVGSVTHPMTEEHSIEWVALETDQGVAVHYLKGTPETSFALAEGEKVVRVYAYCNLHGLWTDR